MINNVSANVIPQMPSQNRNKAQTSFGSAEKFIYAHGLFIKRKALTLMEENMVLSQTMLSILTPRVKAVGITIPRERVLSLARQADNEPQIVKKIASILDMHKFKVTETGRQRTLFLQETKEGYRQIVAPITEIKNDGHGTYEARINDGKDVIRMHVGRRDGDYYQGGKDTVIEIEEYNTAPTPNQEFQPYLTDKIVITGDHSKKYTLDRDVSSSESKHKEYSMLLDNTRKIFNNFVDHLINASHTNSKSAQKGLVAIDRNLCDFFYG